MIKEVSIIVSKCTSLIESNKAGAISECLKEWKKITSDKWVLETVKEVKIDVHNVKKVPLKDQNFGERFTQNVILLIQKEISRLLRKGVITEVSGMELGYLSPMFLREKKENKHRLALNLKELNKFVPHHHFKMYTLKSALNMTRKGCFMASIDLTDAYYSVPIENSLQNFFAFQFQGKF